MINFKNLDEAKSWLDDKMPTNLERVISQIDLIPEASDCVYRVFLEYPQLDMHNEPTSIIAKLPSNNAMRQGMSQQTGMFSREKCFYNKLAYHDAINVPKLFFLDGEQQSIILEDLGIYRTGDQISGYIAQEAISVAENLHKFHKYWLGEATYYDYLPIIENPRIVNILPDIIRQGFTNAKNYFPDILRNIEASIVWLLANLKPTAKLLSQHETMLHGDLRMNNILFDDGEGFHALLDWQLLARGNPLVDIAYFLSQSGDAEERNEAEQQVLPMYQNLLNLNDDEMLSMYYKSAIWGIIIPLAVFATGDDIPEPMLETLEQTFTRISDFITDYEGSRY
jgi:hypothetical protein